MEIVRGALQFLLELFLRLFELLDTLAQAAGEFGEFLCPEEQEHDEEDDEELRSSQVGEGDCWIHGECVASAGLMADHSTRRAPLQSGH